MSLRPFDVVVVPFPYSDRLAEKRRPALVVSGPEVERRLGRVWVAMITSAVDGAGFGDAPIADLHAAGLPAPSLLRASKIATIDADRVLRRAGALSAEDCAKAEEALRLCAGF
jgi:mRNA interferase MazF